MRALLLYEVEAASGARRLFGSEHPLLWLRPWWHAPPGSVEATTLDGGVGWKRR